MRPGRGVPAVARRRPRAPPARSRARRASSWAARQSSRPNASASPAGASSALRSSHGDVAQDVEVGGDDRQRGGERLEHHEPEALTRRTGRRRRRRRGRGARPARRRRGRAGARRGRRGPSSARRRGKALDLVAVVEQRGAAGDDQQRVALGQLRGAGARSPRAARPSPCACSMPPMASTTRRSPRSSSARSGGALGGVAGGAVAPGVDAVAHEAGPHAELVAARARPRARRRRRRASGATIERRWQATSDGVVKASTWWTVRSTCGDHALVAQGRARRWRRCSPGRARRRSRRVPSRSRRPVA